QPLGGSVCRGAGYIDVALQTAQHGRAKSASDKAGSQNIDELRRCMDGRNQVRCARSSKQHASFDGQSFVWDCHALELASGAALHLARNLNFKTGVDTATA